MFVNSAQRANAAENYPPFVNQIRHNTHRATPNAHHRAKALPLPAVFYLVLASIGDGRALRPPRFRVREKPRARTGSRSRVSTS